MVPMNEKDWQAEDDARTLMRANEIQPDPKRLTAAKKQLGKIERDAAKTQLQAKVTAKLKTLGKGE